jgi:potassium-transporting ATPase KdpC subunit
MLAHLRPATVMLLAFTALTGVAYPLAVTAIAQVLMRPQANGSMIVRAGTVAGSALIGQSFASERYFHGRPSAAGEKGYDASASSGSNLGPLSKKLLERVAGEVAGLKQAGATGIPADAVTASASGLDPHISPPFADAQVARVSEARKVSRDRVAAILLGSLEAPALGFLGEPRVNVLKLNLALDAALAAGAE